MSQLTADWSDEAVEAWHLICAELKGHPLEGLRVLYSESACKATSLNDNPKKRRNAAGQIEDVPLDERYNAAGLNQNMPFILKGLGFRRELGPRARAEAFCAMSVVQQLPYVRQYYIPHRGKLTSVSAWYMATFLPAYLSHADEPDYVLAQKDAGGFSGAVYRANSGFDADGDLAIQVRELEQAVNRNCVGARWAELAERVGGQPVAPDVLVPPTKPDLGTWMGIQFALKALGYDPGPVDGINGPKTTAAILGFQKTHPPLTPDGIYGPRTRRVLDDAYALFEANGSTG